MKKSSYNKCKHAHSNRAKIKKRSQKRFRTRNQFTDSAYSAIMIAASFISVGCNREPECLDWHHASNLIAYGAASTVAIYSPFMCKVHVTLRGHSAMHRESSPNLREISAMKVTAVKWLSSTVQQKKTFAEEVYLVSGSNLGELILWQLHPSTFEFSVLSTSFAHAGSIVSLSTTTILEKSFLVSVGTDLCVKLWSVDLNHDTLSPRKLFCVDILTFSPQKACLTSAIALFENENLKNSLLFVAVGGVDGKINVYALWENKVCQFDPFDEM